MSSCRLTAIVRGSMRHSVGMTLLVTMSSPAGPEVAAGGQLQGSATQSQPGSESRSSARASSDAALKIAAAKIQATTEAARRAAIPLLIRTPFPLRDGAALETEIVLVAGCLRRTRPGHRPTGRHATPARMLLSIP